MGACDLQYTLLSSHALSCRSRNLVEPVFCLQPTAAGHSTDPLHPTHWLLLLPVCHAEQEHGVKPKVQGQGTVAQSAAAAASRSRPNAAGRASSSQQQQQRATAPQAATASAQLKPATEFSPFTAVIGASRRAVSSTHKAIGLLHQG